MTLETHSQATCAPPSWATDRPRSRGRCARRACGRALPPLRRRLPRRTALPELVEVEPAQPVLVAGVASEHRPLDRLRQVDQREDRPVEVREVGPSSVRSLSVNFPPGSPCGAGHHSAGAGASCQRRSSTRSRRASPESTGTALSRRIRISRPSISRLATWLSNQGPPPASRQRISGSGTRAVGERPRAAANGRDMPARMICARAPRAGCDTASRPPGRRAMRTPASRRKATSNRYAWCTSPDSATIDGRGLAALARRHRAQELAPSRAKDSWNAAQCSRSTARRIALAERARQRCPRRRRRPPRTTPRRSACPAPSSQGSDVATSRWSKPPVACSSIQSHSSSSSIERLPSSSTRPARESITTSRVVARSRQ